MSEKVLMIGWDFPPHTMGGLGVACKGLTDALIEEGIETIFVLPRHQPVETSLRVIFCDVPSLCAKDGWHGPYISSHSNERREKKYNSSWNKLIDESRMYAEGIPDVIQNEEFDIIHAHDWVSYLAGVAAKKASGKPLIVHVHALSFDQAASDHVDPEIYKIEYDAFTYADHVIAVSERTRKMIIQKFGIRPEKVSVVYNGVEQKISEVHTTLTMLRAYGYRTVLYHGRITIQKGPDYFVRAAKRVIECNPYVMFVISGSGDMERQIVREVAALGIAENVIFAGPLWGDERDSLYKTADLLVMPSVSEPFGIVPLESLMHGTPVIVSKQSGVAEILTHALKVDFWDTEELANMILVALEHPALIHELARNGIIEARGSTWKNAAITCRTLYSRVGRSLF